ncbi:alpha/beta fold hydrolase [Patiriisocius hiemis]|uniref:Alpha/beta hydrolase n=1 Tax=Patiriisocius hiemis TaxID=3075604 RepID=A0ABU2YFH8_9FLAO|nr:alpha/beta hydrolase [Constantimarinum sp. W242]MDT0556940.1 alpha/beta hydrolase [Constantimarinum sp. W242]
MRFLILITLIFSSCTTLQWRETDKEIYATHIEKGIPTKISYYPVDSLDLKIRVQEITQPDNSITLFFIHGAPSSLASWNKYLQNDSLNKKVNLVAIDRPGYGYSNFGNEMPSIKKQSKLLSDLITSYNLKNTIVIGSSYGGPIAAQIATQNKNVKGVIMVSPAIDPLNEKEFWVSRLTQWWITRWMVPTGYRVAGDEKTIHALELTALEKGWKKVTIPVVHIHGDADKIVPYINIEYTPKHFRNHKVVTIPNTGHEIAWANPELILPHIYNLIEEIEKD